MSAKIGVLGRRNMKTELLRIPQENEARFPIEAKQLSAMWKAGYVTANASYWCKETSSWRSIAESRLGIRMLVPKILNP
jgi:hypothetical protein